MTSSQDRLRVLHVTTPARAGGLESVVVQLTSGLRDRGHDVQVAAILAPGTRAGHPFLESLEARRVPVHAIELGSRQYLEERRSVRQLAIALGSSIVHTHGYRADVVHSYVLRRPTSGHLITLHGFVRNSWRDSVYEWLQLHAARRADGVVAVSGQIAHSVQKSIQVNRLHVIANAIAPDALVLSRSEARRVLGIAESERVVGWIGRVSHEKGPDLFVRTLAVTDSTVRGFMIGNGPALEDIKRLADDAGVSERLTFAGALIEARRLLRAFDVLALTSRTEGTPMTILEAMDAGVPVVSFAVGGVPSMFNQADAILLPFGDLEGLADAIDRLCMDAGLRNRLIENARSTYELKHSFESWITHYEALYRNALV